MLKGKANLGALLKMQEELKKKKAADTHGVIAEMFKVAGARVSSVLLRFMNEVVQKLIVPEHWTKTFFSLLHKGAIPTMRTTGALLPS